MEAINVYCQCVGNMGITPIESMKLNRIKDMKSCLEKVQFISLTIDKIRSKK